MPKRKFNYIHLINNKEVTKGEFFRRLGMHYTEVCGNSDNPLLNVEFVDDIKTTRAYNRMKKGNHIYCFWNDPNDYAEGELVPPSESFQIKKVPLQ